MVAPLGIEPNPPAFQTGARTSYAKEPLNKYWSERPVTIRRIGVGDAALCRLSYTRLAARL
jgi:hypothetical protein